MVLQRERFSERKLPWVLVTLADEVLKLGGETTLGIFRFVSWEASWAVRFTFFLIWTRDAHFYQHAQKLLEAYASVFFKANES
jgi:hypothetical protein